MVVLRARRRDEKRRGAERGGGALKAGAIYSFDWIYRVLAYGAWVVLFFPKSLQYHLDARPIHILSVQARRLLTQFHTEYGNGADIFRYSCYKMPVVTANPRSQ